jgi:hypothetical protein
MATTFRTDMVGGIETVLLAFSAAHPTYLARVYRARPESIADYPAAYIDDRRETIRHRGAGGPRERMMQVSVVLVRRITNNAETMAAFDTTVDLLVDALSAVPQLALGTIWNGGMTIADEDAPFGDYDFAAVRFTYTDLSVMGN